MDFNQAYTTTGVVVLAALCGVLFYRKLARANWNVMEALNSFIHMTRI
jgi:biopolymer transport protein ExbB/TolQ